MNSGRKKLEGKVLLLIDTNSLLIVSWRIAKRVKFSHDEDGQFDFSTSGKKKGQTSCEDSS